MINESLETDIDQCIDKISGKQEGDVKSTSLLWSLGKPTRK